MVGRGRNRGGLEEEPAGAVVVKCVGTRDQRVSGDGGVSECVEVAGDDGRGSGGGVRHFSRFVWGCESRNRERFGY